MPVVRAHLYRVAPGDVAELLERRGALIADIRRSHPGLSAARLVRLDDGTYSDTWYWETAEQMAAALDAVGGFPGARPAMSLTSEGTVQNGVVVDER